MGKLTRRVKFIAKERRLSIPAEFLHQHGIERGDEIVVSARGDRLYVFPLAHWDRYVDLGRQLKAWFPEEQHSFLSVVEVGARLRLGSQDRIVLPKSFPFRREASTRMHWELVDGVVIMEPEAASQERPAFAEQTGQASLLPLMGSANSRPAFDRADASAELVEHVSLGRIDWRDRSFAEGPAAPGEALLRSVKVEGVRQPLVLREKEGGFQVVDGFRRLTAARQLRLRQVPAIVWRNLDDDGCRRLRLMESAGDGTPSNSTVQRLQSTFRLHEDRVALREIEQITGRRKRTLQRYLRVAQDNAIREEVEAGRLSIFKAEEILKAGVDARLAVREGWTVKRIREEGRKGDQGPRRREHGPLGDG